MDKLNTMAALESRAPQQAGDGQQKGFRFIITDTFNGAIRGTDDEQAAHQYAECEEYFVYDTVDAVWLSTDGDRLEIAPIKLADD